MRNRLALIACVLLGACHRVPSNIAPSATAYLHFNDKVAGQMLRWGIPWRFPCSEIKEQAGDGSGGELWEERCYRFGPSGHMHGLWRNAFEGSQFCAAPARQCPDRPPAQKVDHYRDNVWLQFRAFPRGWDDTPPGGLYLVDFIGRSSQYEGIFGHMGMSKYEVIVDRLLSIKLLEAPPPGQMTKEHIDGYLKECAGAQICMPNSEVPNRN
jgi:hypothetical protein